jgi:hypothetical protein
MLIYVYAVQKVISRIFSPIYGKALSLAVRQWPTTNMAEEKLCYEVYVAFILTFDDPVRRRELALRCRHPDAFQETIYSDGAADGTLFTRFLPIPDDI